MRELLLLLLLFGMLAKGQVSPGAPQHRPLLPFSQGPPSNSRLPPLPGGSSAASRGIGRLPLDPRPTFEGDFRPQGGEGYSEGEVALQGGDFSPLFSDEEPAEPGRENEDQDFVAADFSAEGPREHSLPSTSLEQTHPEEGVDYEEVLFAGEPTQPNEEYKPQVTTQQLGDLPQVTTLQQDVPQLQQPPYQLSHSEEPLPGIQEEPRYPQHQLPEAEEMRQKLNGQQYEQETQDALEIISLPRPIHRPSRWQPRPRPQSDALHRRPTHPNQLPLYNVIGEDDLEALDFQEAETRERPVQVVYQYEDELLDEEEEEEEEEEEPDRLAILLLNSRFNCLDKNNGYYADEEVDCEVFHYCQDRVKHSWLCPEGASFHQVHLICMPRSEDNICAKSSKFHFVNDFLYKELEADSGTNKTYADRYYPEGFEFGVADVETTGQVAAAQAPQRPAPLYANHQPPPPQQPQYQEDVGDPYVIRRPQQFARPQHFTGGSQGFARPPPYRTASQGYESLEEVLAQRRPG